MHVIGRQSGVWPKALALATAPAAALSAFLVGTGLLYFMWPMAMVGEDFPQLATSIPDRGSYQFSIFLVWVIITLLAAAFGTAFLAAPFGSERARPFSTRRVVGGCLLAFGVTASHAWFIALNVGHWMYRLVPEGKVLAVAYPWYLVMLGWLAVITFFGMQLCDNVRNSRESVDTRLSRP